MILHAIRVENWRCLLGENAVGPFSDGVNILHAPNATGKSTLFEALRCALMDNHTAKGAEIERFRPWGRALSPCVTVEFGAGGREYRIRKSFLDTPESVLERLEDGKFQPLAKGPHADTATRELFTKDAPKRGLSRPEHWGLLQILWAPQGGLALGELSGNLLDDIRQTLSARIIDNRTRDVEERLHKKYEVFFTPTGRIKTACRLASCEKEIEDTKAELASRKMAYAEAEALSKRVRALSERVRTLSEEVRKAESGGNALEEMAKEYEKHQTEFKQRSSDAKAAESEYGRLKSTVDQIAEATKERDTVQKSLTDLLSTIPELERVCEACRAEFDAAVRTLEAARGERKKADECANRAREARGFVELKEKLRTLAEKIAAVNTAQDSLSKCVREKAAERFPSLAEMKKIRKAFADLEKAKIQLDASLITLEIIPTASFSGRIDAGDATGSLSLEAGKPARFQGAPEVRLDIESFGSLRAFGPCESAEEARTDVEKAEAQLRKLTGPFGTSDTVDLEELHERGVSLDSHIEREQSGLNALLGRETVETLQEQHEQFEGELKAILGRFAEWAELPPDPQALATIAEERQRKAGEQLLEAESAREAASKASSEKETLLKITEEKKKHEHKSLESLEERLQKLESDGRTHEQRTRELTTLALSWDSATARANESREKLAAFGENPVEELEKKREALRRKSGELRAAESDCIGATALLDNYAAQGLYTAVARLEEKLAELEREFRREKLAADSIRLLHDTFDTCSSRMAESVTRAAGSRATEIFERIAGSFTGSLVLGESMNPAGFIPAETGATVDVDVLSGGEKEQLHFALRMALAGCAGAEERQLLVLDDTLMATDALRFPRILDIIREASDDLQILILTCQPERFAALTEATLFDLRGIRGRTAAFERMHQNGDDVPVLADTLDDELLEPWNEN